MKLKTRFLYCAMITIILSLFVNGTLAYFTDVGTARNVITTGAVALELIEEQAGGGEYPDGPVQIMPGAEVSKIPYVKAAGDSADAWVRMSCDIVITDASGAERPHTAEELAQIITMTGASSKWVERDGWYYYNEAVSAGEVTDPLFEAVKFDGPNMDNTYQNNTIEINVCVQATQVAHNGASALEAAEASWPKK